MRTEAQVKKERVMNKLSWTSIRGSGVTVSLVLVRGVDTINNHSGRE